MKLLKINCFYNLRSLNYKYNGGLFSGKHYSSVSIAGDRIASESKQAEFIETRLNLWNKLKAEYDERSKTKANVPIKVKLQYGREYEGLSWQTTPNNIFHEINKKAAETAIVALVNNELWDLNRPLEKDCQVELLTFESPLAKEVLWHSSAHVLGSALETLYGSLLNTGPPTLSGFFYDVFNNEKTVSCCCGNFKTNFQEILN